MKIDGEKNERSSKLEAYFSEGSDQLKKVHKNLGAIVDERDVSNFGRIFNDLPNIDQYLENITIDTNILAREDYSLESFYKQIRQLYLQAKMDFIADGNAVQAWMVEIIKEKNPGAAELLENEAYAGDCLANMFSGYIQALWPVYSAEVLEKNSDQTLLLQLADEMRAFLSQQVATYQNTLYGVMLQEFNAALLNGEIDLEELSSDKMSAKFREAFDQKFNSKMNVIDINYACDHLYREFSEIYPGMLPEIHENTRLKLWRVLYLEQHTPLSCRRKLNIEEVKSENPIKISVGLLSNGMKSSRCANDMHVINLLDKKLLGIQERLIEVRDNPNKLTVVEKQYRRRSARRDPPEKISLLKLMDDKDKVIEEVMYSKIFKKHGLFDKPNYLKRIKIFEEIIQNLRDEINNNPTAQTPEKVVGNLCGLETELVMASKHPKKFKPDPGSETLSRIEALCRYGGGFDLNRDEIERLSEQHQKSLSDALKQSPVIFSGRNQLENLLEVEIKQQNVQLK